MKRGICLSGGGSLGSYELGVLKRLKEKNITFDVVTGTSIGAINGAFVCMNEIDTLEKLWVEITAQKVMTDGLNINKDIFKNYTDENMLVFLKNYLFNKGADITPFKNLCRKYISPSKIKNSNIRFGLVCATFPLFEECKIIVNDLKEEYILPYLHASSACFPVFPLEVIDNKKYIDGFYRNNMPLDFALCMGCDEVLCVNLNMFNKSVQKSYLTKLPNVRVIKPGVDLGSFMDFTKEVVINNIIRGYNDCCKYFKDYRGFKYTFKNSKDLTYYADKFVFKIINSSDSATKNAMEYMMSLYKEKDLVVRDNVTFLIIALESLGSYFNLSDIEVYDHIEFFNLIVEKIKQMKIGFFDNLFGTVKNKFSKLYKSMTNNTVENSENFDSNNNLVNLFQMLLFVYDTADNSLLQYREKLN